MMSRHMMWLAVGWVGLAVAGVGTLIVPASLARSRQSTEIAALKITLAQPTDGPEVIDRLKADLEQLRAFGRGRITHIPPDPETAGLMQSISSILVEHGIESREVTTRPARPHGDAWSLPLTLAVSGPFLDVLSVIEKIEAIQRLLRTERLVIRTLGEGADTASRTGMVRAEFSIEAFYADTADKPGQEGAK